MKFRTNSEGPQVAVIIPVYKQPGLAFEALLGIKGFSQDCKCGRQKPAASLDAVS
jgi:hypothetical protein